jgi:hypothetical protein
MRHHEVYRREDFWHAFLAWEHEARRVIRDHREFMPGDDVPDNENEVVYDEDDDDEEDVKMEDVPPAAVKLEDVVPNNYDEDAATAAAMAASLADEDTKWPGYEDVVQLSIMVTTHVASLPPPRPLLPHAPPHKVWDGQEVPPSATDDTTLRASSAVRVAASAVRVASGGGCLRHLQRGDANGRWATICVRRDRKCVWSLLQRGEAK